MKPNVSIVIDDKYSDCESDDSSSEKSDISSNENPSGLQKKIPENINQIEYSSSFLKSNKRRKDDRINKGVTHKIKKPKITKAKKKKMNHAKKCISQLKEVKMPPRLAINRSPLSINQKQKRHTLTSPGFSLLDSPEAGNSDNQQIESKKRFFTSRSKEAATVQISRTIKLSAMNGIVKMTERVGGFEKKNIGPTVDHLIVDDSVSLPMSQINKVLIKDLPSVANKGNRPVPTRFPTTPSPSRRHSSLIVTGNGDHKTVIRSSPRRSIMNLKLSSPLRKSPRKVNPDISLSPLSKAKKTPLNQLNDNSYQSPKRAGNSCFNTQFDLSADDCQELEDLDLTLGEIDSSRQDQDKILMSLLKENTTPVKLRESPCRRESKSILTDSPKGIRSSPRLKHKEKNENVTYFPIFNKNRKIPTPEQKKIKPKQNKKLFLKKGDPSQMIIDAGQKKFGSTYCATCNCLYEMGNPEDESCHIECHNGLLSILHYNGWKNENQVTNVDEYGGRVIKVSATDPSNCWRKVGEVLKIVDLELGFSESGICNRENTFVFMYVLKKRIVGCLIAEAINKAFKVIREPCKESYSPLCCSVVPEKVFIGISRIWVLKSERKKRIATTLVDAMRANIYSFHFLQLNEFAFSDPTIDGVAFAENYSSLSDFLVYRRE